MEPNLLFYFNLMEPNLNKDIALQSENMGIGDWGLGIGDWANPQSPSPLFNKIVNILKFNLI